MRALVLLAVLSGAAALQTQNYYIPMRVEPNEQTQLTLDNLGKLLEFAKQSKSVLRTIGSL